MKKALMNQVTNSIFEVMETMFYLTLEEKKEHGSDFSELFDPDQLKSCKIQFSGNFSGSIFLCIPINILITMTQNFMGENHGCDSEEYTSGTLKEALNMIAGNALTHMDKKSYMGLGIPELIDNNFSNPPFDEDFVVLDTHQGVMASFVSIDP